MFECTEIKPAKNSDFCDPAGIFFKLGNTEVCVLSDLNHEPWRRANDFLFLTPNLQLEHSLCAQQIRLKLYLRLHLPYLTWLACFVHCIIFFCSSECLWKSLFWTLVVRPMQAVQLWLEVTVPQIFYFLLFLKASFFSCNFYPDEMCGFLCFSILFSWQLNEDFLAGTKYPILGQKLYSLLPVLVDLVVGKGWQSPPLLLGLRFISGLQKCSQNVVHPKWLGCN